MSDSPRWQARIDEIVRDRPDWVLMAPYLAYLLLLALRDQVLPERLNWLASVIRGIGGLAVFWLVRKHLPPWGRPHVVLAILCGAAAAAGWAGGQHAFNALGVPQRLPLPLFPESPTIVNPLEKFGDDLLGWSTIWLRIAVAVITVPIVEELFWRAFLLRAMINWAEFEKVPLGQFTWFSFVATSLLSTIQHPDNWLVSIFCWMAFNALMYWKRSVLFLVLVHAFTNLLLYLYMVIRPDWMFW
ncbi:MAG: CAAX prenyl protease-related protein [Phycisphaerae bacterium]